MFFSKSAFHSPRIDCLINADTVVDGNIVFSGGLRVDGIVKGSIIIHEGKNGALIVGQNARIDGRVVVTYAIIDGKIQGDIIAQDFLRLGAHAKVAGDITYQTLEMHHGAVASGKLIHADARPNLPKLAKVTSGEKKSRVDGIKPKSPPIVKPAANEKTGSVDGVKPKPPSVKTSSDEKIGSVGSAKPKLPRSSSIKAPDISVPNRIRS